MLTKEQFNELLERYTLNAISSEERSKLFEAISSGNYDEYLATHLNQQFEMEDESSNSLAPNRAAELLHKILNSEKQSNILLPKTTRKRSIIRYMAVAASLALIFIIGFVVYNKSDKKSSKAGYLASNSIKKFNNTRAVQKLILADGSVISLQPGSTVHYPLNFNGNKREVSLEGEAFFEVAKDVARPFFVYNRDVVTHVLGTSFNIRANPENQQVEVSVRSGKVEVYQVKNDQQLPEIGANNGVVLLPNQKVVYHETAKQFIPSVVDQPLPVINTNNSETISIIPQTVFDETPLKEVLPAIEKTYGIEIITENENLYNCLFTGDISQQDMFTRLEILCKAVGATYEIKGTRILIKGKGCEDKK